MGGCGPTFEAGELYLVFARRSEDGRLGTTACSSTGPLYFHALFFGFLAVLLVAVTASAWGLWRLLRRLFLFLRHVPAAPRARPSMRRNRLPLVWLTVSAGFAALAWLLGSVGPRLAPPVELSVCNRGDTQPLEDVEARLMPASKGFPMAQLGRVPPGECRTTRLALRGAEAVQFAYRLEGAHYTVDDDALEYVEGGFHAYVEVQGPGRSESGVDLPDEPDPRVLGLIVGLLSSIVGAMAALLCAMGTGLWRLRPRASLREG